MVNSKKKGNRGERGVANFFKEWTGWDFHRTPASGGLQWKEDNRIKGDIVPPEKKVKKFPFVVEVKVRKKNKINIFDYLTGNDKNLILKFWKQVKEDADSIGKAPLLFFRYNGMPKGLWLVVMPAPLYRTVFLEMKNDNIVIRPLYEDNLAVFKSDDLKMMDYKEVFADAKHYIK